ncbi:F-box/kelch-repeat protein At3g06240-like [Papaver somniferum]|uniref:F-box/kelch-repeat protein At3g06240-like n=1 Tax=Papaver somniferum TaxID=3469 RepID=UPI000E700581|nr:F-box/kelch-repeat protein At3g06240-like [Papaver somniferum]
MDYASVSSTLASSNRAIKKIDCPSEYNFGDYRIVEILGSCNGLVYLGSNTTQETSLEIIVAFDISTERIVDLPLPEDALAHRNGRLCHKSLAVLGDNLCLLNVDDLGSLAEIWVMLEYGVRVSWTKRYSISLQTLDFESYLKLILSFENGETLMATDEEFVIYDPLKKLRSLNAHTTTEIPNKAKRYVQSLVSPNLGKS